MSTLIKVTFRTTSGEETTGSAQYDADSGLVILPDRLVSRIDLARSTGDRYAITAYEGGYQYPHGACGKRIG